MARNKGQTVNNAESNVMSITQMTAPGASDAIEVFGYSGITCQLDVTGMVGAGTQVIRLEGSMDGTTYGNIFQVDPYNPLFDSTNTTTIAGDITIVGNGTYLLPSVKGNIYYIRLRVVNETDAAAIYNAQFIAQDG